MIFILTSLAGGFFRLSYMKNSFDVVSKLFFVSVKPQARPVIAESINKERTLRTFKVGINDLHS